MTDTALAPAKLDIGKVVTDTFGVLGRNLPTFLGLSALLAGLPAAIQALGSRQIMIGAAAVARTPAVGNLGLQLVGALLLVVGYYLLLAALVNATVADLNGRKASINELIQTAAGRFWPLLGVMILMSLGVFIAAVALLIPGLMLMTAWAVVVPVKVVENPRDNQAFSRSLFLTRGNRWRIFGLLVLYVIGVWIVEVVLGVIGLGLRAIMPVVGTVATSALIAILINPVGATGTAVLYFELRRIREGVGPEALAAVFD